MAKPQKGRACARSHTSPHSYSRIFLPWPGASSSSTCFCVRVCSVLLRRVSCGCDVRRVFRSDASVVFFFRVWSRVVDRVLCLFPSVRFGPSNPVYFPSTRNRLGWTFPFSYDRLQSRGTDVALNLTRETGV